MTNRYHVPASDATDSQTEAATCASAVHIRFAPSQGRRLQRREPDTCGDGRALWAERPILMERADGTYELIGSSTNLGGLARWVLSHGADAEVRGPDRLCQRVIAEARQVLRQYADGN